ncbi:DUF2127 domain-containing protein [Candidatus Peregrinibacteria bacterium]|nr:MAG: DUF2127 domain-containing protein [Candidatus Peregrinibacteria bacterium]
MQSRFKPFFHKLFKLTIFAKGVDGVIDVLTSLLLLFYGKNALTKFVPFLFRKELIEDPKDLLGNYLIKITENISFDTHLFLVTYLAVHGLIKVGVSIGLYSNNPRAYQIAEVVLITFTGYQLYRLSHTHSFTLLLFTLVDILIIISMRFEAKKFNKQN